MSSNGESPFSSADQDCVTGIDVAPLPSASEYDCPNALLYTAEQEPKVANLLCGDERGEFDFLDKTRKGARFFKLRATCSEVVALGNISDSPHFHSILDVSNDECLANAVGLCKNLFMY